MARRSVEELDAQVNAKLGIGTSAKPSYSKKKSVEELDAQVDNKIHKSNIEGLKSAETFNNFFNDVKKNIAGQGSNKNTTLYGLPEKTLALLEQVELNKKLNIQPEIIRGYDYDTEKMKVDHWTDKLKKAQQLVIDIGNAETKEEKERLTLIYNNMSPDNNEDTVRAIQKVLASSKERVDYFEKVNERETANNEYLKKLAVEQQFFQNIFSIKDPNSKFYDEKFDYYVQLALSWDQNKVAGVKNGKTAKELGISEDDYLRYQNLTDEEYEAYNYFLGRYGGETAKQFINQIERSSNSLSLRAAKQMNDEIYSNDDLGLKTIAGAGVGGLERWGQDVGRAIYNTVFYMFNDPDGYYGEEYYRQDVGQLANQLSREQKGGVVKIASDVADAGGYMLPSILEAAAVTYITKGMGASEAIVNFAGRATSALSMGTAVASGSYAEMINLGYSREQAQTYALISGLSEVCLESVLGGIKIPGGAVTGTTAEGFAKSLNKVIGKISIEYGDEIAHFISEIGSEALEESLQEFLSPVFKQLVTGDKFEMAKLEDVLYAGFLGALSASVINSSQNLVSDTVNAFKTIQTGEDIIYGKNAPDFINSLRENANLYPVDSVVGKLSQKVDEKANAYNIGKLFNAENAYLTSQNFTDIQKSLEGKGVNSSDAQTIAQTFAKVVVGEEVSDAEITAIRINKPLFETINDIILNPSSTVNQRTGTVFDLSQKFSDIKKAQKEKATNLTSKIKTAENGKNLDVEHNAELVSLAEEMHTLPAELTDVNTLTPIANTMGVNGGKALMSVYDGNVSTDVYSGEFLKVYNAVLKGNEIPEVSHLTPAQKQAAIFSAQNDLKAKNTVAKNEQLSEITNIQEQFEKEQNQEKGETDYAKETGTESGSESQQRTRSVDSSEQSATVLGRTEKTQSRYQTAESRGKGIRDKVDSLGNEKVSTASLGISKGTSEKTLKVVPRSMYTQEMEAHFKEQFKKGVTVIYFVGELQMKDENGNVFAARGAISTKATRMFVRADHETLSVTQIIKHEQFHIAVMKDPSLLEKVSQSLIQKYGEEDLDELVNSYVDEYGWDSMDMSYQEIVEEILADAYAGIDVFDYLSTYEGATRYTEDVVDQVESHTIENETNRGPPEIKNTATESDDVKFSIEVFKGDKKYVKADRQVFSGDNPKKWGKQVTEYINNSIRDNKDVVVYSQDGDALTISKDTAGKAAFRNDVKLKDGSTRPMTDEEYAVKLRAESHIDEISQVSKRGNETVPDKKNHNFAKDGFNYRTAYFMDFDGKYYRLTISVGKNGVINTVYNVGKIKEEGKYSLRGSKPVTEKTVTMRSSSSTNSISNNSENVNNKTSREKPKANNLEEANALLKEQFDEIKSLKKDLSKAESEAKQYRAQVKLTEKAIAMREDRIKKLARRLFDNYSVELYNLNISEVIESLENLGEYISNGGHDGTFSYTAVKDKAVDIATQLIDNARELVDDGQREIYNGLRKYLRNTRLTLSEQDRADIGENWNDFRRKYFGTINLSNKGLPVDSAYMELQSMYGNSYFPEKYTHPADQLAHIAEVMDKLKPVYENPNNHDMAAAIECCANDIVYSLFNEEVQQSSKMILHEHDKYVRLREEKNNRIKELQKEGVKNTQEALEKIRKQRDEKVRSIKKEWEDKKSTFYEVQRQIELREMITRHSKELSKKLLRPTDKQHIPEDLKRPVAKLLELINLESVYTIDETGKRRKNPYGIPTKRTEAFKEIRAAYKELADDLVISPELFEGTEGGLFEKVEKLSDKPIAYMNSEELLVIWKTISAVEATITSYNQAFSLAKEKAISDIALSLKNDNKHKKSIETIGMIRNLTNVDMLTPETFFHELGETGDMLFRGLRNAQDKYIEIFSKVEEFAKELKADSKKLEKEIHEVTLGGQTVNVSTANLMELYVLYNRPHAKRHIEKGGVSFQRAKGLKKKNYSSQVYTGVTVYELEAAFAKIGAENIKKAEKMQEFLSTVMADYGNEASMQVFNYKKYLEQHYWPIRVSGEEIQTSLESVTAIKSIANKSHAKQTVENAKASIEVGSIFDTFISHCVDMSSYAAYLAPMQDMTRIINSKFYTELGKGAGTVKEVIKNVYGTHKNKNIGLDYIQNLMADISSPGKVDKEYTSGLFANFKAAAVGLNLRVVAQQPTAILRAFDMINPKYFVNLKKSISGWNKAKRYAPIAQWKDWGYFDINTGLSAKEIAFGNDNALSFVREKSMALAGLADSVSWGMLWNACEAEIKDTHKELKVGSEEFYKTVAQRFTEIIDHTQVVDGVLQRSQIMRKKDSLTKMSTAFMGEPTKIYNMLRSAWYDVKNAKDNALIKKARVKLARSVVFLCISNFINAAVQSLVDAFRDDDRDETYWQKFLQAFFGFEGDEKKTLSYIQSFISGNIESAFIPFNYFPYAKDLISLFQGYDVSRTDMQGMSDLVNASITLVNALTSEEGDKYNTVGLFANFFAKAANVLGIPVANLKRDIESIVNTVSLLSENYLFQYYSKKLTLNVNHIGNAALFKDILWDAYQNDPVAYEKIYSDLEKEGFKMESIKNYFEDRMKEAQNIKSVDDLKERYLSPTQERKYDSSLSKVKKSNVWKSASSKYKKEVETDIYNLTVQNSDGEKLQEKIDGGKQYGVDETEYLLFRLALDMVDKPTDSGKLGGPPTNEERENALKLLGLSEEESSYLWLSSGGHESTNPYD